MDATGQLLKLIASGDRRAFDMVYQKYWKQLFKRVYQKVQDVQATEDILHDLFMSIWKNRARLDVILNFEAYLNTGARYLTFAYLNKQQVDTVDIQGIENIFPEAPIEDRLHYRYILDLIQEEVENLPQKCKIIFKESRYNNKSIQEIALEYGISKRTVENQINKAIKRIREVTKDFYSVIPFLL